MTDTKIPYEFSQDSWIQLRDWLKENAPDNIYECFKDTADDMSHYINLVDKKQNLLKDALPFLEWHVDLNKRLAKIYDRPKLSLKQIVKQYFRPLIWLLNWIRRK